MSSLLSALLGQRPMSSFFLSDDAHVWIQRISQLRHLHLFLDFLKLNFACLLYVKPVGCSVFKCALIYIRHSVTLISGFCNLEAKKTVRLWIAWCPSPHHLSLL